MKYYLYRKFPDGKKPGSHMRNQKSKFLQHANTIGEKSTSDGYAHYVHHNIFEDQPDGKVKCLICNTYTIPGVYKGAIIFYNLEDGYAHRQSHWNRRRRKNEYICCIPFSINDHIKTKRIGRFSPEQDNSVFNIVE